ncbi:hypothetical protein G6F65_017695 [Rhizopus arrhizus]|nr:hypothetical protein G6F65_017695 [Rhizopus arrhizus]
MWRFFDQPKREAVAIGLLRARRPVTFMIQPPSLQRPGPRHPCAHGPLHWPDAFTDSDPAGRPARPAAAPVRLPVAGGRRPCRGGRLPREGALRQPRAGRRGGRPRPGRRRPGTTPGAGLV